MDGETGPPGKTRSFYHQYFVKQITLSKKSLYNQATSQLAVLPERLSLPKDLKGDVVKFTLIIT
ncbi:MAG: hypothetical protein KKC76_16200 [Proteobacteria bacterium]|nr:hypothetical protein [Pseudomonadota bacterium]MBU4298113.1 hypothetical protein [Pseudomonadota bacterium]MCG2746560.1 hypothetical protein [Desulfobulbaceae bacterium]